MQTTMQAIALIKAFEGYKPEAYLDPVGIPTVGYGITKWPDGEPVMLGDSVDHAKAEELLFGHVRADVEPALDRLFGDLPLQPNERDALASFVYNFGETKTAGYTLTKLIKTGATNEEISDQWVRYRMAGGQRMLGLYRRRLAEVAMWWGKPWDAAAHATWATTWRDIVMPEAVEPVDVDHPDLAIPPLRRADPDLPAGWDRMTENEKTHYLNTGELIRIGGDPATPGPDRSDRSAPPVRPQPVPALPEPVPTPPLASTRRRASPPLPPHIPPNARMAEDSDTVEGRSREREGERWLGAMRVLLPSGVPLAFISGFNQWPFWHLFAMFSFMTLLGAGYGAFRLIEGRRLKEYGRSVATEPKW